MDLVGVINDSNCSSSSLTGEEQEVIFIITQIACSVGVVVTSLAIVILLLFRSYRLLIFRIVLYVMIANLFNICVQLVEVFPVETISGHNSVKGDSGWMPVCRILGFLDQVTSWMGPPCLLWLVVHIIDIAQGQKLDKIMELTKSELVGIGLCFFLPFTFNWIPFIDDYYGFSGSWCWIKATKEICNDTDVTTGYVYILTLYYGPLLLFVLVNTIACIIIFRIWWNTGSDMKVVIFVILYPLIYDILFIIVTTNRLYSMISIGDKGNQSYPLWIAHALAEPARVILPSMLVIIQWAFPLTRKLIKNLNSATIIVNGEPDENDDLIPRI